MAISHLKSTPVTNDDATPIVPNTTGEGGKGYIVEVDGYVTAVAADSIDTTYRFVRVPTTAKIKSVTLESEAQAAGAIDIGVYYPTTGKTAKADLAANAIDQDFFASAVSIAALVTPTNVVNESTTYSLDKRTQPLWQAVGLTSDPTGFFDIVATVTTAITTGTGKVGLRVSYVD